MDNRMLVFSTLQAKRNHFYEFPESDIIECKLIASRNTGCCLRAIFSIKYIDNGLVKRKNRTIYGMRRKW